MNTIFKQHSLISTQENLQQANTDRSKNYTNIQFELRKCGINRMEDLDPNNPPVGLTLANLQQIIAPPEGVSSSSNEQLLAFNDLKKLWYFLTSHIPPVRIDITSEKFKKNEQDCTHKLSSKHVC